MLTELMSRCSSQGECKKSFPQPFSRPIKFISGLSQCIDSQQWDRLTDLAGMVEEIRDWHIPLTDLERYRKCPLALATGKL